MQEQIMAMMATFGLVFLGIGILMIIAQWRIYQKAGKGGWEVLIPIYNILVLLDIIGKPRWWIFMFLIPIANIIFAVKMINNLSKSFGKDEGFTVGLIFLGIVFYPILGFGKARYIGPVGDPQKLAAYQQTNQFDFDKSQNG